MDFYHNRMNPGSSHGSRTSRHYLQDRLMVYRLIFITSLFWICVDLCVLAYLMNETSLRVEIKTDEVKMPVKSMLGQRDSDVIRIDLVTEQNQINVAKRRDEMWQSQSSEAQIIVMATKNKRKEIIEQSEEFDVGVSFEEEKETVPFKDVSDEYFVEDYSNQPMNPQDWPGEQGKAVRIDNRLKDIAKKRFEENQFNIMASEMIAINRSLPDTRNEKCKNRKFSSKLPTTSIVIVYHNEGNSTLLRGLVSLVNRSPRQYLKEIILVDDASEKREYLHRDLDEFVKTLPVPVQIFRNEARMGLIRSRIRGASAATADTLTFLDAHIEATNGWLPPLLAEIKKNRKAVVCPVIDVISDRDFSYYMGSDNSYGGFDKSFTFNWFPVPEREQIRRNYDGSSPLRSPTMAGGLFTIDRNYFYELGTYDSEMDIWGSENVEMSLRIWMCGGILLMHPCSHVGHIFRSKSPYTFPGGALQIVQRNKRRVIDVWTDEYRQYFYYTLAGLDRIEAGNLTERISLRQNLKCKSFKWYLENIFPEAPVPLNFFHVGRIRNKEINMCLDTMGEKSSNPSLYACHNLESSNQLFVYSKMYTIVNGDSCFDLDKTNLPISIKFSKCKNELLSQQWMYSKKTQQFVNQETKGCLSVNKFNQSKLILNSVCDPKNSLQKWLFTNNLFQKPKGES